MAKAAAFLIVALVILNCFILSRKSVLTINVSRVTRRVKTQSQQQEKKNSSFQLPTSAAAERLPTSLPISHSDSSCDFSSGRWVPDSKPPLYSNATCKFIQPSQNCLGNGRQDKGYLNWRWKPNNCELPYFEPALFLRIMSSKKMVFIGDSIARNHMQSLLCALAQVEEPEKIFDDKKDKFTMWTFRTHNFTLANIWSPFLVNHTVDEQGMYRMQLDTPEIIWSSQLHHYDMAVISTGYWYFRPSIYYLNNTVIGCNPRSGLNLTIVEVLPAYRMAHANILKYMLNVYKGVTVLRTITVDHFEYGSWNTGGVCNRTGPYSESSAPPLPWMTNEMNKIQVEEFGKAIVGGLDSVRLKLMNVTLSSFMRPDGHPGFYRAQAQQKDCLHWCLPGPIDTWNQFILYILQNNNHL